MFIAKPGIQKEMSVLLKFNLYLAAAGKAA